MKPPRLELAILGYQQNLYAANVLVTIFLSLKQEETLYNQVMTASTYYLGNNNNKEMEVKLLS